MPEEKDTSKFNNPASEQKKHWSDYPDNPDSPWRESDFCRFVEIDDCGMAYFEYVNRTPTRSDLHNCVLSGSGSLERIDVVDSEKSLKNRIFNIKSQNGNPDESEKALESMRSHNNERCMQVEAPRSRL